MGPIPQRWKGICESGQQFNSSYCNRKLIGARWLILSPRDVTGHGTHSASTAVGSPVASATFCGLAVGVARGGASLARHAVYKVLWTVGGSDADILEVFDYAIHVGVDVLSFSIGTNRPLYSYVDEGDSIAIGTFHAMARAITVVCAGGNTRPPPQTVVNTAPWILTVAASTNDRAFPTAITFGNNSTFLSILIVVMSGQAMNIEKKLEAFVGLVDSMCLAENSSFEDQARHGSATGKIVLCFTTSNDEGSQEVASTGGIRVIFAQPSNNLLSPCAPIPCTQVNYHVGTQMLFYIQKSRFLNHCQTLLYSVVRSCQKVHTHLSCFIFRAQSPSSNHISMYITTLTKNQVEHLFIKILFISILREFLHEIFCVKKLDSKPNHNILA
ncbi:hypothetical protein AMTRI_Chr05g73060 [Amborella trichopoda]